MILIPANIHLRVCVCVCVCPQNAVVVADAHSDRVCVFGPGGLDRVWGRDGRPTSTFDHPVALTSWEDTLFVLESTSGRLRAFK